MAAVSFSDDMQRNDNIVSNQYYKKARDSLEKLLSNVKHSNVTLEEKLQSETLNRTQREREVEEHKGLWESEVKSRSKLGANMLEKEKAADQLKLDLENEKRKTRRALELKKTADNKLEIYEQRSLQHQKETSALRNKLKQYQKKFKELEYGESRVSTLHAEFDKEREQMSSNVTKLRLQLDQLSERLLHEQNMRNAADQTNRDQIKEMTELKTKYKVQQYDHEKLISKCQQLENELEKQRQVFEKNFIPQEEIDEFKRALETKSRLDLNKKLQEVNMHLEEQSLAREAFEKIRNEKEAKMRKESEATIQELKLELSELRTSLHEGFSKRDTSETEAKRFKELFQTERNAKDRLTEKLAKTTEQLSLERNRTNYLFDETINKPKVNKKLFDESFDKDRFSPRRSALESNAKMWSTPAAPTHTSPERDYLAFKKRHQNILS